MTTPKAPERKFTHSVWVVDVDYDRKGNIDHVIFLFAIDNYEGAYSKWLSLIETDKRIGITSEMIGDIEVNPDYADSWEIDYDEKGYYSVNDVKGDFHVCISLYEESIHKKEK